MTKRYIFFFLLGLFITTAIHAQFYNKRPEYLKANSVWAFGNGGGYDFNTRTPFTAALNSFEQSASVADPITGQLLFYVGSSYVPQPNSAPLPDVGKCWNRNHQVMPNGNNIKNITNSGTAAQGSCIVPVIDSPGKYYIFSLNEGGHAPGLRYSVIDMNLDNGLGDIISGRKDIVLDASALSEAMVTVPGNNCDIWLLVHAQIGPTFKAYHITRQGISPTPIISTVGTPSPRIGLNEYSVSLMAISPDRTMLALGVNNTALTGPYATYQPPGRHVTGGHLFKFDANTGTVSDAIRINAYGVCYGLAFSPDNSKLYTWTRSFLWAPPIFEGIRQYDVSMYDSTAIVSSAYDLATGNNPNITSMFLYNDTIYVASQGNPFIDRINNPNLAGAACNYQYGALPIAQGTSGSYGLPTGVTYPLPPDTMQAKSLDTLICTVWDSIVVQAQGSYNTHLWNNGDTGATYAIKQNGTYWVRSGDACNWRVDTFIVRGADVVFNLGNDTVICNEPDPFILKVSVPGATYLWQDGNTDSTYKVTGAGDYSVQISKDGCISNDTITVIHSDLRQDLGPDLDLCPEEIVKVVLNANAPAGASVLWNDGSSMSSFHVPDSGWYSVAVHDDYCHDEDTIYIARQFCDCFFEMPSAFTPNSDGRNDIFRPVIEPDCPVRDYTLRIFTRWGEQVFTSVDTRKGWDGMQQGNPAALGVYMYEVWFRGGTKGKEIFRKGDVTLVR